MDSVKVGLIGFGTIGVGVAEILLRKEDEIARKIGKRVKLVKICDKDTTTDRGLELPDGVLTSDVNEIFNDPSISIVIELIGGLEPARTFILRALESGKSVVTANKALIAHSGAELFAKARECGQTLGFEASVCGGVPVLAALQTSLLANKIESIQAICNGTCNFVLSEMESKGAAYEEAVKEAQRLGFAEANPTLDVNGSDATQKLAILAHLAFGAQVDWQTIPRVGVDVVSAIDVRFARELGRKIRLLATARLTDGELELKVAPTLVPEQAALAKVTSAFNAIQIVGDFVGPLFYQGWGAGRRPTASAVCSDVIDAALGRVRITFDSLRLWSAEREGVAMRDASKLSGRAYLRFVVEDRPGVMAEISSALGRRNISIAQMMQDSHDVSPYVSLIILTHEASSSALSAALDELRSAPFIHGETTLLDVVD